MTRILSSLSQIATQHDVVLCDLWGCLHNGITAYPAAVAALQDYRRGGGYVILLTNSPRPKDSVARQIAGFGVPEDAWDDIVTSGDAAQFGLVSGAVGHKVYHIGADKDDVFFNDIPVGLPQDSITRVGFEEAEGIVVTGLPDLRPDESPEDFRGLLMLARERGMKLLCANPDIIVDRGDRREWCAGAIAQLYDQIGGQSLYFGKPHPPIYDLARRRLELAGRRIEEARILAIGDGPGTDVAGALAEGLECLFVTGGLAAAEFGPDVANPDPALLEAWLARKSLAPGFSIGLLR